MSWVESIVDLNRTVATVFGDGVDATYNGTPVDLVLDQSYVADLDYQGTRTVAYLTSADYTALGLTDGETLTINGVGYVIRETEPDAEGMTMIVLEIA